MWISTDIKIYPQIEVCFCCFQQHCELEQLRNKSINQHGHTFIEFLNDAKLCVLNGRFTSDNYTSISTKGNSVVDYLCVPQDMFDWFKSFTVLTVKEITDRHNLHGLIGVRSRLLDHSALLAKIDLGFCETDCSMHGSSNSENQPRFNLKRIPNDFMDSDMAKRAIVNMITRIERCRETQGEIDDIYDYLCEVILKEMSDNIPKARISRRTQKRRKHTKPFWNDELQSLWNILEISAGMHGLIMLRLDLFHLKHADVTNRFYLPDTFLCAYRYGYERETYVHTISFGAPCAMVSSGRRTCIPSVSVSLALWLRAADERAYHQFRCALRYGFERETFVRTISFDAPCGMVSSKRPVDIRACYQFRCALRYGLQQEKYVQTISVGAPCGMTYVHTISFGEPCGMVWGGRHTCIPSVSLRLAVWFPAGDIRAYHQFGCALRYGFEQETYVHTISFGASCGMVSSRRITCKPSVSVRLAIRFGVGDIRAYHPFRCALRYGFQQEKYVHMISFGAPCGMFRCALRYGFQQETYVHTIRFGAPCGMVWSSRHTCIPSVSVPLTVWFQQEPYVQTITLQYGCERQTYVHTISFGAPCGMVLSVRNTCIPSVWVRLAVLFPAGDVRAYHQFRCTLRYGFERQTYVHTISFGAPCGMFPAADKHYA
ncbi:hypothetical protein MAR_007506 [Mya arenaria]|uniref:Uncharacterized protein n=1 Tax=Mya arenaria TaxID=6604 RepID=A0ABY7DFA6_MYAAR|nr:hypothetical protein MAR_007506 [Mya arenaria]